MEIKNKVKQIYTVKEVVKDYTLQDIKAECEECKEILKSLGYTEIENNRYEYQFMTRGSKSLGQTAYNKLTDTYTIRINKRYMENCKPEDVHNTIMHEMIHSISKTYMNHGWQWKAAGERVCNYYNFTEITRVHDGLTDEEKENISKYTVTCKSCGAKTYFTRKTKIFKIVQCKAAKCKHCGGIEFNIKQNY